MDPVVHFEIPMDNVNRATSFYKTVFEWNITEFPGMNYWGARTAPGEMGTPMPAGVIGGGLLPRHFPVDCVLITIQVESIDQVLESITKNGGQLVQGKNPVADMGFTAYFKDTEGNVIGLWENVKKA